MTDWHQKTLALLTDIGERADRLDAALKARHLFAWNAVTLAAPSSIDTVSMEPRPAPCRASPLTRPILRAGKPSPPNHGQRSRALAARR
jgi:hypothetical protein